MTNKPANKQSKAKNSRHHNSKNAINEQEQNGDNQDNQGRETEDVNMLFAYSVYSTFPEIFDFFYIRESDLPAVFYISPQDSSVQMSADHVAQFLRTQNGDEESSPSGSNNSGKDETFFENRLMYMNLIGNNGFSDGPLWMSLMLMRC